MQFTPIWIITLSVLFISSLVIVFLAKFATKPIDSQGFSFKRVFPFETLKYSEKLSTLYQIFLMFFVLSCFAPLLNMIANSGEISNLTTISIAICCIYGLAGICFLFLHYFDATHTIVHLILFVLFLCLTMLGNALAAIKGFSIFKVYSDHGQQMITSLIGCILCGLCSIFSIILCVNPKLKNWAVLDKVESGYARPRVFILAYSEWLTFFILVAGELSYFLILLIQ